jgi:hypothetical protein
MSHESDLGRGSGWTEEGMSLYNRIHHIVKEDRIKSGNNFNQELAKWVTARQNGAKKHKEATIQSTRKRKPVPVDDLDEFYACQGGGWMYNNTTKRLQDEPSTDGGFAEMV